MSDLMKWPGARDKGKSNKPDNTWLKFVSDSHLEWLMDMGDRMRSGEVMDAEDTEHYTIIKEQALTFMTQAEAERWSEEDRRVHMIDSWWRVKHATS